jgi:polyisoprenyl-teichoic acid--peptidoglycan teichoic acid transferase
MTEPPPPSRGGSAIEPPIKKPPPEGDGTEAPKPKRYWWRFTLGSLVIISVSAAATATSILLYVGSIANALSHNDVLQNKVERILAQTQGGEPENILILGSDKRASEAGAGRSDTTILLRLDPDNDAIALMSIPRDLKVEIPGVGTDKFNAAYAYGGPKLALTVVKEITGLPINHVVNVDYLGFVRAVYAIGCVYVDVDRRYYHSNIGVPPSEQYSEINVQPGYQLMCGKKALEYVRYRHTDTDLVRAARQQDFLSAARQRVPIGDLVLGGNDLIEIFTEYTTSDISDKETMLEVLKLFISSRNAAIKEVHFPAELGPSYVTASPEAIEGAVNKFLGIEASGGPRGSLDEGGGHEGGGTKKAGKKGKAHKSKPRVKPKPPGDDGLIPAREAGELEAKAAARKVSHGFPVFYPTRLPSGAFYAESNPYLHVQDPRVYHLKDEDGHRHGAYRMVVVLELPDGVHYFGVQGIQGWSDPPILSNPSLTKTINGRDYDIFLDGDRVKLIAWHRGDNTYWVSNSLLQVLTNNQMVGIARSADVIIPNKKRRSGGTTR